MIYLAGIIITFFLVALLTGKKNKTQADRILIVWLCAIGLHLLLFYLYTTGKIYNYPFLLGASIPYPLIHGPLLYLYTIELTGQAPKRKRIWLIHFIPLATLYLFMIPFLKLSGAEKIIVYQNKGAGYEPFIDICYLAIIFSGIIYISLSLFLLRRYRISIKNEFSNIEKINLAWLRYLIYGIAVIWLPVIFGNDKLVYGTVVLFVFFLGYFGIRQVGIFTFSNHYGDNQQLLSKTKTEIQINYDTPVNYHTQVETETDLRIINDSNPKLKYEKSGLGEIKAETIYNRLTVFMANQKIFTDSELTLGTLAKTLEVHPNHLSQVINSYEGRNFYDYINFYRVEEFKKLAPLPGNKNYTLLSLAFEVGFNSKTSFNRNFKKATGVSPSEWLQQQNISLN